LLCPRLADYAIGRLVLVRPITRETVQPVVSKPPLREFGLRIGDDLSKVLIANVVIGWRAPEVERSRRDCKEFCARPLFVRPMGSGLRT
jgi:hypothetical protein